MKIDRAIEEINTTREKLTRIEAWLKKHLDTIESCDLIHPVSTSLNCGGIQLFFWAGPSPFPAARRLGGSCKVRGDSWEMIFPDFQVTFMEAVEATEAML